MEGMALGRLNNRAVHSTRTRIMQQPCRKRNAGERPCRGCDSHDGNLGGDLAIVIVSIVENPTR